MAVPDRQTAGIEEAPRVIPSGSDPWQGPGQTGVNRAGAR